MGDFHLTLANTAQTNPESRAAIISPITNSNVSCSVLHQPFSSALDLSGFHSLPTANLDNGAAVRAAMAALQSSDLGWKENSRKVVIIVTAGAPALEDSKMMNTENSCDKLPSPESVGSIFRSQNAALIVFTHNDEAFEIWRYYADKMDTPNVIQMFRGIVSEFPQIVAPALQTVLCPKSSQGSPALAIGLSVAGGLVACIILGYGGMKLAASRTDSKAVPVSEIVGSFEGETEVENSEWTS